ncbi:MAG TPA: ketoacyl-ACP synthase III [Crenotrichaceae bacterium]|nr:ketoacyl-ACP synthase III [Crenotrichaceae bacterium]
MRIYSRIAGTGGYLPSQIRTNEDISKLVDTSDEWIFDRTGIHERRIAGAEETASSMAEIAARRALEAADLQASRIDLIIVATSSPDTIFPSTACLLQNRLKATQCAAFDIQAACSGFIYALSVADQFIQSGTVRKALVVGSEINSRLIDWNDRRTCILFGDGAGAVVLTATDTPGVLSTHIHSDGNFSDLLYVPNPVGGLGDSDPVIHMSGNEVFKVAVNTLGRIVDETLAANQMQKSDIDWLVPHQANIRIINATAKKLGMALDKVVLTIERQGNTSSASVPLALDEGIRDGRIKRGDTLLMEAFGGGFVWGSALVRY